MIITVNDAGYITGYATYQEMMSGDVYRIINADRQMECPDFPIECPHEWEHFKSNYRYYTFHPVPPEYWLDTYGPEYEIPACDIASQFVYHPEHENVIVEEDRERIRALREIMCFPIINRGQAWYLTLTDAQKDELRVWYQAWLDAPQTLIVPSKPRWLT